MVPCPRSGSGPPCPPTSPGLSASGATRPRTPAVRWTPVQPSGTDRPGPRRPDRGRGGAAAGPRRPADRRDGARPQRARPAALVVPRLPPPGRVVEVGHVRLRSTEQRRPGVGSRGRGRVDAGDCGRASTNGSPAAPADGEQVAVLVTLAAIAGAAAKRTGRVARGALPSIRAGVRDLLSPPPAAEQPWGRRGLPVARSRSRRPGVTPHHSPTTPEGGPRDHPAVPR